MILQTLVSTVLLTAPLPPEGVVSFQGGRGLFRVYSARTLPRAHLGFNLNLDYTQAAYPRTDSTGTFNDNHHFGEATLGITYSAADFLEFFTRGDFNVKYDEQEGSRDDEFSWYLNEGGVGFKTGGIVAENVEKKFSWSPGFYGMVLFAPTKGPDSDEILSDTSQVRGGFIPFRGHDPDGEFGLLMDFSLYPLTVSTNLGYLATGKPKEDFYGDKGIRSQELHGGFGIQLDAGTYLRLMLEMTGDRIINDDLRNYTLSGVKIYPDTFRITPGMRFVSASGFAFSFGGDIALTPFDFIPDRQPNPGDDPIWKVFVDFSVTSSLLKTPEGPSVATLTGKVTDVETGNSIGAEITFPGTESVGVSSDPETGIYKATLGSGPLRVRVSKEGYRWMEKGVQLKKDGLTILDFALEKKLVEIGTITGRVNDARTGNPLGAMISLPDLKDTKPVATNLETGIYKIQVPSGTQNVKAESEGFEPVVSPVVLTANQTVIQNFLLKPKEVKPPPPPKVEVGQRIILRGIYFSSGSARIEPRSYAVLDDASRILKDNPTVRVEIQGHTDSVGDKPSNLNLSQSRAESVKSFLIGLGIGSERMVARGYGEDMPVASNLTTEGRSENRRIEFLILSR